MGKMKFGNSEVVIKEEIVQLAEAQPKQEPVIIEKIVEVEKIVEKEVPVEIIRYVQNESEMPSNDINADVMAELEYLKHSVKLLEEKLNANLLDSIEHANIKSEELSERIESLEEYEMQLNRTIPSLAGDINSAMAFQRSQQSDLLHFEESLEILKKEQEKLREEAEKREKQILTIGLVAGVVILALGLLF